MSTHQTDDAWSWTERMLYFLSAMFIASMALTVYVGLEWIFFVTKPSMFTGVDHRHAATALWLAPFPYLMSLLQIQTFAGVIGALLPWRFRVLGLIPASFIFGSALLLLLDNFTYIIFNFGIISTGTYSRLPYVIIVVCLVFLAARWLLRANDSIVFAASAKPAAAVALVAFAAVLPLGASVEGMTDHGRVRAVEESLDEDEEVPRLKSENETKLPNVLVITVDGVPADRTSLYGYERRTTPFLERFREDALLAQNAFSNGGRTHGSLTSIATGKLPMTTRVIFPPQIFREEDSVQHLPGILRRLGYRNVQISMRHFGDAHDAGLIDAFDLANYRWEEKGTVAVKVGKKVGRRHEGAEVRLFREAVIERIRSRMSHIFGLSLMIDSYGHVTQERESPYWNDRRRVRTTLAFIQELPQPWFLQLHLLDTHCCSRKPRKNIFSAFGPRDGNARFDGEIHDADDDLSKVVAALKSEDLLDRTLVIITSDHSSKWTTTERLPFLMRFPHGEHAGTIDENVQLIDIPPTILDYLGQQVPSWIEGNSLIGQSLSPERPIFGISRISDRESAGGELTRLSDFGPPRYGVETATLIVGEQLFEIWLDTGEISSRTIENHTAPTPGNLTEVEARELLVEKLENSGFAVGPLKE